METETRIEAGKGLVTRVGAAGVDLTLAELRELVQFAHDTYGITADPFATPGSADCPCPFPESCSDAANRAHNEGVRA